MWSPEEVIAVADSLSTNLSPVLSSTYAAAVTRTVVCAKWLIGSGIGLVALAITLLLTSRRQDRYDIPVGCIIAAFAAPIGILLIINGVVDLQSVDFIAAKKLLGLVFKGSSD